MLTNEAKNIIASFKNDFFGFMEFFFPVKKSHIFNEQTQSIEERIIGGWETRNWQRLVMSTSHKYKVLRVARRGGKSYWLCAYSIWKCFTNDNYKVLMVTPDDGKALTLFNMVTKNLIGNAREEFKGLFVKKINASPPRKVEILNSFIEFKTAGTKTGGKGDALRGFDADLLILEEADYFNDEDVYSIIPILYGKPHSEAIVSSTPTGRDSAFKSLCNNAFDYKTNKESESSFDDWAHFHFNCWEAKEHWNEKYDKQSRKILGPAYEQEELAEFGKEVRAVFNKESITECTLFGKDYYNFTEDGYPLYGYPLADPEPDTGINIMTMDWDTVQSGPTIMVSKIYSYLNEDNKASILNFANKIKFRVLRRVDIPIQEFAMVAAKQQVVDMVKDYGVKYIYCDQGYGGEFMREELKLIFQANKFMEPENVYSIAFNKSVKYRNSLTNEEESTTAKQFMVNMTQQLIAESAFIFNPNDDILLQQLRNYRIIGVNNAGNYLYNKEEEHSVDTLMLSVLCAYEKLTDLFSGKESSPNSVISIKNFVSSKNKNKIENPYRKFIIDETVPNNTGIGTDGERRPIFVKSIVQGDEDFSLVSSRRVSNIKSKFFRGRF